MATKRVHFQELFRKKVCGPKCSKNQGVEYIPIHTNFPTKDTYKDKRKDKALNLRYITRLNEQLRILPDTEEYSEYNYHNRKKLAKLAEIYKGDNFGSKRFFKKKKSKKSKRKSKKTKK